MPPGTDGILQEMTVEDVRAFRPEVVVLGFGSTEPHGPALPYGSDWFQCDALCRRAVVMANERHARCLMYPVFPIGNNVNFKALPFAARIRVRTLMDVVLDIIEAVEQEGIRKIVLVNSHGGNSDALNAALREHFDRKTSSANREGAFVCIAAAFTSEESERAIVHPSQHGGEREVSQLMHLQPNLVRKNRLTDQPIVRAVLPSLESGKVHFVRPWHLFVPLSGGGDNRLASAEKGEALVESYADGLAEFLVELSAAPWTPEFPYAPVTGSP